MKCCFMISIQTGQKDKAACFPSWAGAPWSTRNGHGVRVPWASRGRCRAAGTSRAALQKQRPACTSVDQSPPFHLCQLSPASIPSVPRTGHLCSPVCAARPSWKAVPDPNLQLQFRMTGRGATSASPAPQQSSPRAGSTQRPQREQSLVIVTDILLLQPCPLPPSWPHGSHRSLSWSTEAPPVCSP